MRKRNSWLGTVALLVMMAATALNAQDDWKTFRGEIDDYYYYLARPEVENFTYLISSEAYINYVRTVGDSTHFYPVKFIWTNGDNRYYALQSVPAGTDSLRRQSLERIQRLKNLHEDILYDFQKFVVRPPAFGIPENAWVSFGKDTVAVRYSVPGEDVTIQETFTRGGQLGRVMWKMGNQKAVTFPIYREVGNRWLCVGWRTQKFVDGEVTEGLVYELEQVRQGERWVPIQLNIVVQSQDPRSEKVLTGMYKLYIKGFAFNADIREVTEPQAKEGGAPPPPPAQ